MKNLKSMRQNSLALGVKLNRLAEQRLLDEMGSLGEDLKRFHSKYQINDNEQCWNWLGASNSTGYGQFKLFKRKLLPHRVSYIIHNRKIINKGLYVCHSCDNKKCVNPHHLWIGTNQDNQLDGSRKGLLPDRHGELCPTSKLKNEDIFKIKLLILNGMKQNKIASYYKISTAQISRIKNGSRWTHL